MNRDQATSPRPQLPRAVFEGRMPHPFPYQGSKRKLAGRIVQLMPDRVRCLYEPFAGSAAVSIAAASRGKAGEVRLNDIHTPLIALWNAILSDPNTLCEQYEALWFEQSGQERQFFDDVRARFNTSHDPADLLYLLARCVKAAIRYNSKGEFNNSPDKRRLGMHPKTMRSNIVAVHGILRDRHAGEATSVDYAQAIADATADDLVYMDPPYQGTTNTHNHRYMQGLDYEHFVEVLQDLVGRRVPFIISYDGRTGSKVHGRPLPKDLGLYHEEIHAGRSTQATLLGRSEDTIESLYLSPCLVERLDASCFEPSSCGQPTLFS